MEVTLREFIAVDACVCVFVVLDMPVPSIAHYYRIKLYFTEANITLRTFMPCIFVH